MNIDLFWNFSGNLYAPLLQVVGISVYISLGNYIDLSDTFAIMFVIHTFQTIMGSIPTLIP